jgi:hypothetical protein
VSETRRERLKEMARAMRREPTEAEKALWTRLASQKLGGFKFHRQVVIGSTIVDFRLPGALAGGRGLGRRQRRGQRDPGQQAGPGRHPRAALHRRAGARRREPVVAAILEELKKPSTAAPNAPPTPRAGPRERGRGRADQAEDEEMFVTVRRGEARQFDG